MTFVHVEIYKSNTRRRRWRRRSRRGASRASRGSTRSTVRARSSAASTARSASDEIVEPARRAGRPEPGRERARRMRGGPDSSRGATAATASRRFVRLALRRLARRVAAVFAAFGRLRGPSSCGRAVRAAGSRRRRLASPRLRAAACVATPSLRRAPRRPSTASARPCVAGRRLVAFFAAPTPSPRDASPPSSTAFARPSLRRYGFVALRFARCLLRARFFAGAFFAALRFAGPSSPAARSSRAPSSRPCASRAPSSRRASSRAPSSRRASSARPSARRLALLRRLRGRGLRSRRGSRATARRRQRRRRRGARRRHGGDGGGAGGARRRRRRPPPSGGLGRRQVGDMERSPPTARFGGQLVGHASLPSIARHACRQDFDRASVTVRGRAAGEHDKRRRRRPSAGRPGTARRAARQVVRRRTGRSRSCARRSGC